MKLVNFSFLIFVFSIPIIPIELNVKILILALLFSFFSDQFNFKAKQFLMLSWAALYYITVIVIGVFYSEDITAGMSVLETNFSFLAMAVVGGRFRNMSSKVFHQILRIFVAGAFSASILCLIAALINFFNSDKTDVFFYYKFTQVIDSHPTYFAYYLIFSITILLYEMSIKSLGRNSNYLVLLVLFLFSILTLTGGRTSFIGLLLISSFFLLKAILSENGRHRLKMGGLSILMILGMFVTSSFQETAFEQNNSNDATWERMQLWEAAINANQNYLLGVGTGDYKSVLNEYYTKHNLNQYAIENYNSHNQFVQIFFSNGLLGLIAVLLLIGRPLFLAIQHDHVLGILVFFPFLIYGMTEVFLGRYQGVVFFAFLHQLFVSYYLAQKPPVVVNV